MEGVKTFKAALTGLCGALTALWGWMGWLVLAWVVLMALDYLTGSLAAIRAGKWSSTVARDGIWHKGTEVVVVTLAAFCDLLLGLLVGNLPGMAVAEPFAGLVCPLVLAWYALTELGSILENSGKMGGPRPKWFRRAVAALRDGVDGIGGSLADSGHTPPK